jgi:hypothetical protein
VICYCFIGVHAEGLDEDGEVLVWSPGRGGDEKTRLSRENGRREFRDGEGPCLNWRHNRGDLRAGSGWRDGRGEGVPDHEDGIQTSVYYPWHWLRRRAQYHLDQWHVRTIWSLAPWDEMDRVSGQESNSQNYANRWLAAYAVGNRPNRRLREQG